ncbi:MAG: hypothetical protein Q9172_006857, partial [Xanthocarpia lactea]
MGAEEREFEQEMGTMGIREDGQAADPGAAASERKASTIKPPKGSHDDRVMDTNNSSIVSKRSVERLYHETPHFFRYFVKKPIRRSPLINRGYWLRMHAIEQTVLRFLRAPSEMKKIVLNLGCGYDPLPFQCLSKYSEDCTGVTFADVDHPELMSKKRDMILEQSAMKSLVGRIQSYGQDGSTIVMRSDHYVGVGCDLRDIARLTKALEEELQIGSCLVLCTAEVSITYMDVNAADALITWAAQYDNIRFCMLEQLLPQGQGHPFAQKMIQHFTKLGTPLRCVHTYPLLQDQESRFLRAGFHSAKARTLWHFWQDQSLVALDLRLHLNEVEPFDEWEEFALFSSHYFILEAKKSSTSPGSPEATGDDAPQGLSLKRQSEVQTIRSVAADDNIVLNGLSSEAKLHRKFGAVIPFSEQTIGLHGGISDKGRVNTTIRYQDLDLEIERTSFSAPPLDVDARVCHTITALDEHRYLLAGGRTSPDNALRECWLYFSGQWKPVDKLPIPLYRHCATTVAYGTVDAGVLVFGGRTTRGAVVNKWFLWREATGWTEVFPSSEALQPRFGAAIASTNACRGVLLGGMTEAGVLCDEYWEWVISYGQTGDLRLRLNSLKGLHIAPRLGACLVWSFAGLLLIGGISTSLIPVGEEILRLSDGAYGNDIGSLMLKPTPVSTVFNGNRNLLVGHAVYASGNLLLIAGGGAVCFSFGSYWNTTIWAFGTSTRFNSKSFARRYVAEVVAPLSSPPASQVADSRSVPSVARTANIAEEILRVSVESAADFDNMMSLERPFVIRGLDLGSCTTEWTIHELIKKIDADRLVTVHQAQGGHMNFQMKNFDYVKKPFGEFMHEACNGSPQYLRSLNAEKPAQEPAHFYDDFPSLQDQFQLPQQLETVVRNQHSSPLRISGPVNMWLHYDVMANVLCQIVGTKVVALYPPMDAVHFKIPPGSSSSPMTVFHPDKRGSVSYDRHHTRAVLKKGDVLYIPPLWLHSTSPLENLSVSINVFFCNLKTGYSAGRDVYGNRDLQAYENGRRDIKKLAKSMERLPRDVGSTYLASAPLVTIKNATFYRQHPTPTGANDARTNPPLFPNLTFELPSSSHKQQHWSVIGPSSTGKTTFFEILRGQHLCFPPTSRSYPYLSSPALDRKDQRLRNSFRAIQYVGFAGKHGGGLRGGNTAGSYLSARYESRREPTDFTVLDYLKGIIELNPSPEVQMDLTEDVGLHKVIHDLDLEDLLHMPVGNLSNGQTRRAKIAKALLDKPEVLLLDEPFMGLDPPTTRTISPLLHRLAEAQAPRILMSLRPQDPLPEWITHIVHLGPELRVAHQGPKHEVLHALGLRAPARNEVKTSDHEAVKPFSLSREGLSLRRDSSDSEGEPIVEMSDVRIKYGDKVVLGNWQESINGERRQGLNWIVRRGQRWGVFGPNGSGKTTLLSLICSDHPQSYSLPIRLFSLPRLPQPGTPGISIFDLQSRIGHSSPETHSFFPTHLSVRRCIESAWSDTFLSPPALTYERDILVDTHLKWFEPDLNPAYQPAAAAGASSASRGKPQLTHGDHALYLDSAVTTTDWADTIRFADLPFSAQRLALFLRAVVKKPDLVVLDEAFSGMDAALRDRCLLFLTWGTTKFFSKWNQYCKRSTATTTTMPGTTMTVLNTPEGVLDLEGMRVEGLSSEQALIVVSHVPEEVPGLVKDWMCLPEAVT